jgi:hypothetical protein
VKWWFNVYNQRENNQNDVGCVLTHSKGTIFWGVTPCGRQSSTGLHGVTTQKIVLCEVTAVRTSSWLFTDAASKLYSVVDRTINECGVTGRMRIGRGN